jgi:hypothetical protein
VKRGDKKSISLNSYLFLVAAILLLMGRLARSQSTEHVLRNVPAGMQSQGTLVFDANGRLYAAFSKPVGLNLFRTIYQNKAGPNGPAS